MYIQVLNTRLSAMGISLDAVAAAIKTSYKCSLTGGYDYTVVSFDHEEIFENYFKDSEQYTDGYMYLGFNAELNGQALSPRTVNSVRESDYGPNWADEQYKNIIINLLQEAWIGSELTVRLNPNGEINEWRLIKTCEDKWTQTYFFDEAVARTEEEGKRLPKGIRAMTFAVLGLEECGTLHAAFDAALSTIDFSN